MSGFSLDWLGLREPADARARWPGAVTLLAAALPAGAARIVDLGCGSGANCRYLAPRLPAKHDWQLVDNDPLLLGSAAASVRATGIARDVAVLELDLAAGLASLDLAGVDVVTASALLDLVSAQWFDELAVRCAEVHAVLLFALSYDGRIEFAPADPDDVWLCELVNLHQRGDKGFGPALGPDAAVHAQQRLESLGYAARVARSDWLLGAQELRLQQELLEGWANAAIELRPRESRRVQDWKRRRLAHLAANGAEVRVGHTDLVALPHGR